jgi:hypothetical protein
MGWLLYVAGAGKSQRTDPRKFNVSSKFGTKGRMQAVLHRPRRHALAYVYVGSKRGARLLTRDEERPIAANIAKVAQIWLPAATIFRSIR